MTLNMGRLLESCVPWLHNTHVYSLLPKLSSWDDHQLKAMPKQGQQGHMTIWGGVVSNKVEKVELAESHLLNSQHFLISSCYQDNSNNRPIKSLPSPNCITSVFSWLCLLRPQFSFFILSMLLLLVIYLHLCTCSKKDQ